MIVYIEQPIKWNITDEIEELLDELHIDYSDTHILEQKLILDEWDTNFLFSDVFMNDVKIEYGNYGGEGSDFSISIYSKEEK